jgi:CTP synthase (UTP-ammonia lyase)
MAIIAVGDRDLAFLTHREVDAALELFPASSGVRWHATDVLTEATMAAATGVWLLPGTPYRNDDTAYAAIRHCLDTGTPFLGTCGGFQYACVELARRLAGVDEAAHAESEPGATALVISPLACSLYGERRTVVPRAGTRFAAICGVEPFEGFHYCGYGVSPAYADLLEAAGVVVGATAIDVGVEAIELPGHPFFLATAFQPQVGASETGRLSPLIAAFVAAAR